MKWFIIVGLFFLSTFLFISCATILNSTTQEIEIKTTPPNAKLIIDGKKFGTTPQVVNMERKNNHIVKLDLDGYDIYETQITTKLSFWFWGNIFNGFIPGAVVDLFTGAMYNLLPESFNIELQPSIKTDLKIQKK